MLNEPIYPSWMVSPGHKCQIAGIFVNRGLCSERAACRHLGLHRSTFQYEAKQPNAWLARLKIALKRMSRLHPELGYSKITRLLNKQRVLGSGHQFSEVRSLFQGEYYFVN